jgi:hypothetical protein
MTKEEYIEAAARRWENKKKGAALSTTSEKAGSA